MILMRGKQKNTDMQEGGRDGNPHKVLAQGVVKATRSWTHASTTEHKAGDEPRHDIGA